ncbi:hypothetical protein ISCGN_016434 [Ixodes scapularis]
MEGILVGDSQLKFLTRQHLRFTCDVQTCTFSVGGATAALLLTKVRRWLLRRVDFFVVYVGGNDLDNGRRLDEVCRDILDLVEHLRTLATTVFVFKVLPQCWADPQDERRRLALNRKLAKGVKGMADVVAIKPDLEPFAGDKGEDWNEYTEALDQYFIANQVEEARLRAVFLSSCGRTTHSLLRRLLATASDAVPNTNGLGTVLASDISHYMSSQVRQDTTKYKRVGAVQTHLANFLGDTNRVDERAEKRAKANVKFSY